MNTRLRQATERAGATLLSDRRMDTLVDIARRLLPARESSSKGDQYYEAYEKFFCKFRLENVTLFEIGVFNGDSTQSVC
jgi:hypothetical protein